MRRFPLVPALLLTGAVAACTPIPVDPPPRDDRMVVEGRIRQGVECPIIETRDGRIYALTSRTSLPRGEWVRVRGVRRDFSYCMQGRATIEVTSVRRIDPPRRPRA